jgi:2-keto-4-pentenoate hydratase/2-oxohepta-3-ene-1,7-dioic acid hydratase in catechol pathway
MKIVAFQGGTGTRLGVVENDMVIDLQEVDPKLPGDLAEVLAKTNGDLSVLKDLAGRASSGARRPLKGLKYAQPVGNPGKIVCLGLNYLDHVKEGPSSMAAHEQAIIRPKASEQFDYEAELVAIVGKKAKHLTEANALDCIVGYSCSNEGSVREFQRHTTQWGMGKNFDQTGGFGPWMVTADELPPGGKGLKIQSRINGQGLQNDNTENMMFPLIETLVYLTKGMTLMPGDIILTGTPSGVGHPRKPPLWMKAGDVAEIEIEGVGVLRNPVEDEK